MKLDPATLANLVDERLLRNGDEVQIGKFRLVYFGSNRAPE